MKELFLITKCLLKNSLGKTSTKKTTVKSVILIVLVYLYLGGFFGYVAYSNLNALIPLHYDIYFMDIFIAAVMLYVTLRGVFVVMNTLYFSKDTEDLLPLPINEKNIIRAKILVVIISQYMMLAILLLPELFIYGFLKSRGISYYLISLFEFIIIPIIPTMLVTFIISLVMSITKRVRGKEFIQYISIIITLVIVLGIQYTSTSLGDNYTNVELGNYIYNIFDKTKGISAIFFTKPFLVNLLVEEGLKNQLIMIGILLGSSLLTLYLLTFIISRNYIKIVTSMKDTKAKKFKETSKMFTKKPLIKTYVSKEFKLIRRNSTFMIQCLASIVVCPILILGPFLYELINMDANGGSEIIEAVKILYEFIGNSSRSLSIGLVIIAFMQTFNLCSVTAISRDGEDAILIKQYPIKPYHQIIYKIMPGFLVNAIVNYILILVMYIFFNVIATRYGLEKLSLLIYAYLIIHSTILTFINNLLFIKIDINNPKTHWTSETQVTKQNINALIQFVIIVAEIFIFFTFGSMFKNLNMLNAVLLFIELILYIIVHKRLNRPNIFDKIN